MMEFGLFCSQTIPSLLSGYIYPLSVYAAGVFAMVIGLSYAVGQATSNPKLTLWAKTEIFQLGISLVAMFVITQMMLTFCTFSTYDIVTITGFGTPPGKALSIYDAAEAYLNDSAKYSKTALTSARYYLGAINEQEMYSQWECPVWCFFTTGATGTSIAPEAGASFLSSGFTLLLNSSTMSFISSLMHVFFLNYVGSGFFLLLMPIAIMTRSAPYMRTFGSLIIAMMFSFYVIYPSMLAAFYVALSPQITGELANYSAAGIPPNESGLKQRELSFGSWASGYYALSVRTESKDIETCTILAAKAFFYSVFMPTIALLTTAGAVMYVGRLLGEEIDLSRLMQMV